MFYSSNGYRVSPSPMHQQGALVAEVADDIVRPVPDTRVKRIYNALRASPVFSGPSPISISFFRPSTPSLRSSTPRFNSIRGMLGLSPSPAPVGFIPFEELSIKDKAATLQSRWTELNKKDLTAINALESDFARLQDEATAEEADGLVSTCETYLSALKFARLTCKLEALESREPPTSLEEISQLESEYILLKNEALDSEFEDVVSLCEERLIHLNSLNPIQQHLARLEELKEVKLTDLSSCLKLLNDVEALQESANGLPDRMAVRACRSYVEELNVLKDSWIQLEGLKEEFQNIARTTSSAANDEEAVLATLSSHLSDQIEQLNQLKERFIDLEGKSSGDIKGQYQVGINKINALIRSFYLRKLNKIHSEVDSLKFPFSSGFSSSSSCKEILHIKEELEKLYRDESFACLFGGAQVKECSRCAEALQSHIVEKHRLDVNYCAKELRILEVKLESQLDLPKPDRSALKGIILRLTVFKDRLDDFFAPFINDRSKENTQEACHQMEMVIQHVESKIQPVSESGFISTIADEKRKPSQSFWVV